MRLFNETQAVNKEHITKQIDALKSQFKTMVLATNTTEGQAEASYAPYICLNNRYYIILSKVATHYDNIQNTQSFQGMVLEDEKAAISTFFRKRVIFNLRYQGINEDREVIEAFSIQHGQLVNKVLEMDFAIFELKLLGGRVILGPGQAFRFDEQEEIVEQIIVK